jgi:hypothetical protein
MSQDHHCAARRPLSATRSFEMLPSTWVCAFARMGAVIEAVTADQMRVERVLAETVVAERIVAEKVVAEEARW